MILKKKLIFCRQIFLILWGIFDLDSFSKEILRIEQEASNPDIWNDHEHATSIMRKLSLAKKRFSAWENLQKSINDLSEVLKNSQDDEPTTSYERCQH